MIPDAATRLYGVIGNPIAHSRSPAILNPAFAHHGLNASYLAFRVESAESAIRAMRALDIGGFSVTIPHKIEAMRFVDDLDASAVRAGALNTVVNRGGRLTGYNYDGEGALVPLRRRAPDYAKRPVAFLGAGGSARGIALAMAALDGASRIDFFLREPRKAAPLLEELGRLGVTATALPLGSEEEGSWTPEAWRVLAEAGLIVNTTPVGMHPKSEGCPLPSRLLLETKATIYDIVYNPLRTTLVERADRSGRTTIGGAGMFLGQAALQFRLWTGLEAPHAVMEKALLDSFAR